MKRAFTLMAAGFFSLILAGCQTPTVNLATTEPIKVDIDMRLDVYQHSNNKPAALPVPANGTAAIIKSTPESRRDNRMADIQGFKNSRLIGEGRDGLVVIVEPQSGELGDYLRKTVEAENADRLEIMNVASEKQKISLPEIQRKQGELWRNQSFKGELIEVPGPDNTWKWTRKEETPKL